MLTRNEMEGFAWAFLQIYGNHIKLETHVIHPHSKIKNQ